MISIGGSGISAPGWVQKVIIGQMAIAFFMPFIMSFFVPEQVAPNAYQEELDDLINSYNRMTGQTATSEEVWALSGIYTPYGTDEYGKPSTQYGVTDDGWIYGQRIGIYNPTQYDAEYKDETWSEYIGGVDNGRLGYVVSYDSEKKLYYYTWAGEDLQIDYKYQETTEDHKKGYIDPEHPQLYTRVHMDTSHKSSIFITHGGKHEMENGTFYYEFTGYRYQFVALEDYNYSRDMSITAKTSSCSLIWYQYTSDSGIAGQLVVSGTDKGVQYITGGSIVRQFDQATSTAKFTMTFNGVDVYVYVMLDPYALKTIGLTPEECYNNGYFSLMITTPKYASQGHQDGSAASFDINKMWEVQVGLFTFHPENYGLEEGSLGGYQASIIFVMPLYAALFALGTIFWPILIIQGLLAQFQQMSSLWPF